MKTRCAASISTALVLAFLAAPGSASRGQPLGEWRKIEHADVVIEFQDDMEELARQLLPEAVERLKEIPLPDPKELDTLIKNKNAVLQFIAVQLGLQKPGENMSKAFDAIAAGLQEMSRTMPNIRHVRIWHKETLKKLLIAGQRMPHFTYDSESDKVRFQWIIVRGEGKVKGKQRIVKTPALSYVPIVIVQDPERTALQQAVTQLDMWLDPVRFLPPTAGEAFCHEVAEAGMVMDLGIKGAFRRWFCDGVANYIAGLCLEEFVSKSAAAGFFDSFDPSASQHLKDRVDLLSWRAGEWEKESPYPIDEELAGAHYGFATYEIRLLIGRHGKHVIPAIFKEISKSEVRNEEAIFAAIRKVTGEDFKTVLSEYGAKATDHFKGIAIKHFVVGPCERNESGKWRMTGEATAIPLITDGKHGVGLHFHVATAALPVAVKIEVVWPPGPDGKCKIRVKQKDLEQRTGVLQIPLWLAEDKTPPGDYFFRVYFNDELYREVEFKLVQDGKQDAQVSPVESRTE